MFLVKQTGSYYLPKWLRDPLFVIQNVIRYALGLVDMLQRLRCSHCSSRTNTKNFQKVILGQV